MAPARAARRGDPRLLGTAESWEHEPRCHALRFSVAVGVHEHFDLDCYREKVRRVYNSLQEVW